MERSIYNLEHTEKVLHLAIDRKEEQLNEVMEGVRKCVKDGKKQMAKTFLRKKHMIENDIMKTMNILDNVQAMLQRVHSSKSDKEILKTYKMGSDAIKIAFAENGINLDSVHDVIEDMQDIYDNQAEYETAISEPLRGALDIDDSDLEKELMEMMSTNEVVNKNNAGNGGGISVDKKHNEMDLLDRELELRLKRLRSDVTTFDEPQTIQQQNQKAQLNL
jgi:charged multivesicular body protein 7